jgi:RNA polymerase sigma-70 factor (ECF subfamily)
VNSSDTDRWFAEQVQPYEAALRGWLRARFPDLTDVDDVVQEALARVVNARATVRLGGVKAFLFATARNLVVDQIRRRRVASIESIAEIESLSVFDETPTAAESTARHQEIELLTLAIQSLPDRCRQVLTLRKIYGLSQRDIATRLGISEHTVEAQVGVGMRRCAAFLARFGLP